MPTHSLCLHFIQITAVPIKTVANALVKFGDKFGKRHLLVSNIKILHFTMSCYSLSALQNMERSQMFTIKTVLVSLPEMLLVNTPTKGAKTPKSFQKEKLCLKLLFFPNNHKRTF